MGRRMCRWLAAAVRVGRCECLVQYGYPVTGLALAHGARRHGVYPVELAKGDQAALFASSQQVHHGRARPAIGRQRLASRFVLHELERPKDTQTAYLAETRVLVHQLLETRAEHLVADEGRV